MDERGMRGYLRPLAAFIIVSGALLACSSTYGSADDPLPPSTTCALDCGAHGTCEGSAGAATCACSAGYLGPDCRGCAPGFQDDDRNGTCESLCGATTCGAHATCAVEGDAAVCTCTLGYTSSKGGSCVWSGGPKDPGFQNIPAGAWKLEGDVRLNPTATGAASPGLATFGSNADDCKVPARVSQTFAMPAFADAEPLALKIVSACKEAGFGSGCRDGIYRLGLGGRFALGPRAGGEYVTAYCLGERAFGVDLGLVLEAPCGKVGPASAAEKTLDDVSIAPSAECPKPGTIPNPDFEGTGGWTAVGAGAEIAVGAGTAGSRAAHLAVDKTCDSASLTGVISVPAASVPSPALAFSVRGTTGTTMSVAAADDTIASVRGTGVFETVKVCLPQWGRGLVQSLRFSVYGGSGVCAGAIPAIDFVFDDLAIVSDPSCGEPGWVTDGGFERKSSARPGSVLVQEGGTITYPQAASAHGGTSYLQIQSGETCQLTSFTETVTVPDAQPGAGGPQLRFWSRATGGNAAFTVGGTTVSASNGWVEGKRCLDPQSAGRATTFTAYVQSSAAGCSFASLGVDDVDIVHDTSCPE